MTVATILAAPVPTAKSAASANAAASGPDAFADMVSASADTNDGSVDDAPPAAPARPRRAAADTALPDDVKADADETPAGLLTGVGLFAPPIPPKGQSAQTDVKSAEGLVAQPAPPVPTTPAPLAPSETAAADKAASDAFAAAVAEQAGPTAVDAAPEQTASIALAAGLAKLLRPTPTAAPTTDALNKGNASAANADAGVSSGQTATEIPTTAPTALTSSAKASGERAADPALASAPQIGGQATPSTEDRAASAPIVADARPADVSPTAAAATPVASQTPSVTPGLSASLSSLSHATIETTAQIAAQITRQLNGKATRFEMGLTPEGLGRVDVRLDIDADGQLTARLAFDNPLAATDLRGRADELRSQLQDAGFKIAQDALSFSQRDPSGDRGADQRQSRAFAAASRVGTDADLDAASTASPWMSLSLTPRGVDMKV